MVVVGSLVLLFLGICPSISCSGTFYRKVSNGNGGMESEVKTIGFHHCSKENDCNFVGIPVSKTDGKVHSAEKIEELQNMEKKLQIWKKMEVKDPKADSSSTSSSTTPGFKSCQEAQQAGKRKNGVIKLSMADDTTMDVLCNMKKAGGGWIVFQKRLNNKVSFQRSWLSYENGFGSLHGNFWMGLKALHHLTSQGRWTLRIDLKGSMHGAPAQPGYAEYTNFRIGSEEEGYKLTFEKYSGNIGNALARSNGVPFSTEDEDNDEVDSCDIPYSEGCDSNCARVYKGAWWHADCSDANLNSWYPGTEESRTEPKNQDMMSWKTWSSEFGNIYFSEMKMRME